MIKFIDLKRQYQLHQEAIDARIKNVLEHSQYISGPEVSELEQTLAEFVGVKHCIALDNGTVALQVALLAAGVQQGDEVITSPFSFFASVSTILQLGAMPVFVDINPQTYNLDVTKIEQAITSRTKAILPISLFGQCPDFDPIIDLAKKYNLVVIEDAAQSFGAKYKDRNSCSITDIACTSFFPSKPLGCYGDGGACFTNNDEIADHIRSVINHGQQGRYHHVLLGINGRCDTIQAAILLAKMELFPKEIELRKEVASFYNQQLAGKVKIPYTEPYNQNVYAQYTIRLNQRDLIQGELNSKGIPTAVHYPLPLYRQPVVVNYLKCQEINLPHVELAAKQVLSLPFDPYMTLEKVDLVCTALLKVMDSVEIVSNQ